MLFLIISGIISSISAQGTSTMFPPGWNKEATAPPMGWRSWNAFGPAISTETIMKTIDAISAKNFIVRGKNMSLADIGYSSVGIDEGWENCSGIDPNNGLRQHDIEGYPMVNTQKFPDLKALVDYGHANGVNMGWYLNGCACGERKERLLNYQGDVQRLYEYGFDAAKFDGCGAATNMTLYAELMQKTGRTYAIENCHWGSCGADKWYHNPDGSSCPTHTWCPFNWFRTSGDINNGHDSWFANLQTTIKFQNKTNPLSVPSCWAYPDMMEVGRIADGTLAWSRAHFGAWCIVSAPLILGLDITDTAVLQTLLPFISNPEAIAVNQRWAGHPGRLVAEYNTNTSALPVQVWAKPQPQNQLAVYIVNPSPVNTQLIDDPLSCFEPELASEKKPNVCFGQYKLQFPAITTLSGCAVQCLQDAQCTDFVWALPSESGTRCRLSRTCKTPTDFLAGFDGYMRVPSRSTACGTQPGPPIQPFNISINFSDLGLKNGVNAAGVRDIWAQADLTDATDATLKAAVLPQDSVLFLLTPK